MPRVKSDTVKSSAELTAEIKQIADKQKAAREAKRREEVEDEQARAIEEAEFNKDFVEMAKGIRFSDYKDDDRTIYDLIRSIIRPPVKQESVQGLDETDLDFG